MAHDPNPIPEPGYTADSPDRWIDEPETPQVFHERAEMLHRKGYQGFRIVATHRFPGGIRMVASNERGHRLQADGEHPTEILQTLVEMIDAYKE